MDKNFKRMTDFLLEIGIEQVPHTQKSYLAHLIAVFRDLEKAGCPDDVCRAGMFHSIYGTEKFQGFTLPVERRGEVRALIGERAEYLAYLNCAMDRASFDRAVEKEVEPFRIIDRLNVRCSVARAGRLRRPVPCALLRLARTGAAVSRVGLSTRGLQEDGRAVG